MIIAPAFVALLSLIFAISVWRKWIHSHKVSEQFWLISLLFSFGAALAYCISIASHPHSGAWFRTYYLLGGLWMPSLMGLGSLGLVWRRRTVNSVAALLAVIGLIGSVLLLQAPISWNALATIHGGPGIYVIQPGLWLPFLILMNSLGALAVFLVALWSVYSTLRRRKRARFLFGNLTLAIGIAIISAAGTAARLGMPSLFWWTMVVGWCVTFGGYLLLTPRIKEA
ncbi:hypothetical protein [Sulfoacidibacillus thermotolerans]|uniref:Histidine kinase N-terminal 7TM region domain-containing protein n=1 Tax=Sulfoacidibacillus thermotolerans TaxID=1765684 RepID=A0A2U3DB19_SULT2|nr:hypothetical protein [Sulfoacidibacillus thermotolerans]PWI58476.1 hypothetical protein BM613_02835 [Sulfoacidibacillus thermotolerans]